MSDITTAIDAEIATLDAALSEMTARRLTLVECRTLLTTKPMPPEPPMDPAIQPIPPIPPRRNPKPVIKPRGPRGERKSMRADLTADDIRVIREGAADGYSQNDIRGWFEDRISRSTISNIVLRKGCYANM